MKYIISSIFLYKIQSFILQCSESHDAHKSPATLSMLPCLVFVGFFVLLAKAQILGVSQHDAHVHLLHVLTASTTQEGNLLEVCFQIIPTW